MPLTKETTEVIQESIVGFECDHCHRSFDDVLELQESHRINFVGGYGSVFGDGHYVEGILCQYCLKDLLGNILKIT